MLTQLFRAGRDAELRYTQDGKPVANVSAAFDVGFGERKRTSWIEIAIWGPRAEALAPNLTKGTLFMAHVKDIEAEAYTRNNGEPGAKLKGTLVDLEFAGGGRDAGQGPQSEAPPAPRNKPTPAPAAQPNMYDDDIPF